MSLFNTLTHVFAREKAKKVSNVPKLFKAPAHKPAKNQPAPKLIKDARPQAADPNLLREAEARAREIILEAKDQALQVRQIAESEVQKSRVNLTKTQQEIDQKRYAIEKTEAVLKEKEKFIDKLEAEAG